MWSRPRREATIGSARGRAPARVGPTRPPGREPAVGGARPGRPGARFPGRVPAVAYESSCYNPVQKGSAGKHAGLGFHLRRQVREKLIRQLRSGLDRLRSRGSHWGTATSRGDSGLTRSTSRRKTRGESSLPCSSVRLQVRTTFPRPGSSRCRRGNFLLLLFALGRPSDAPRAASAARSCSFRIESPRTERGKCPSFNRHDHAIETGQARALHVTDHDLVQAQGGQAQAGRLQSLRKVRANSSRVMGTPAQSSAIAPSNSSMA